MSDDEWSSRSVARVFQHPASAKSLLMTVLGEFVLPNGEAAWTSTLLGALDSLDAKEHNARQAIARLSDQGLVRAEHHGRLARWHLTDSGRALLKSGADRIYRFGKRSEHWDGRWLVVLCPLAGVERSTRHQLRTQLAFEGFGFVSPEAAISPHTDREARGRSILDALNLLDTAVVFRAEAGSFEPSDGSLAQAWDLGALGNGYEEFMADFAAVRPVEPRHAFASTVRLVHAWRHFPFNDPELPTVLLGADWPGRTARELFEERRLQWADAALRWYLETESRG